MGDEEWPRRGRLSCEIDVFGRVGIVLLLWFVFMGGLSLGLIGIAVGGGVEGIGGLDLVLELIAGQAGVLAQV